MALAALEKELRVDADAIRVMTQANLYGLALTDDVALGMSQMSDWALGMKRIQKPVRPEDLMEPKFLAEIDPQLVRLPPKR